MAFPETRLRRLRTSEAMRGLVCETDLSTDDLLYPIFVTHGRDIQTPIVQMPGCYQLSLDNLLTEVAEVTDLGIPGVLLFGIPAAKDSIGSEAYDEHGIVQEAIRTIKQTAPGLLVATDVCMCQYTDHGHCGVVTGDNVDNDATLDLLVRTALSHVEAGADIVAPSAMMDGQVRYIRESLDTSGYQERVVMSYAAKYASSFYGPFRTAAESVPQFGDRRGYQMAPGNLRQAMREIELDIQEGSDIVIVKPALAYLDVIARAKNKFDVPLAAYNVSGEYSMVMTAACNEGVDKTPMMMEILTGMKRAGADIIITYHAKDVASVLAGESRTDVRSQ